MRSIGEFFGHIAHGAAAPIEPPVRRKVEEETRDTPAGKITLRRTTIEEVRIEPPPRA